MTRERLDELLEGLRDLWRDREIPPSSNPMFQGVHLAGGEPFREPELLLHAVARCSELRLYVDYVETNAEWCSSKAAGVDRFAPLAESGLRRVLISCSPFHAERIPLKRTLAAIEAAQEVFGRRHVIVYMPEYLSLISELEAERPVPLDRWTARYGAEKTAELFWRGYGLIPGGRAGYRLGHLCPLSSAESFAGEDCSFELIRSQHAHFDPDGNFIPFFCGGLSLGRIGSLPRFYSDFALKDLPLASILVRDGPHGLMELAKKRFGYEPFEGYAGKCHLCVDVRRHIAERTKDFDELAPRKYYEMLLPA